MTNSKEKQLQTAQLKHLRMAPRKVRLVAGLLKGMSVNNAEAQLLVNPKRATEPLLKLLKSAISNAKNQQMDVEKLFIKEIRVDGAPMLKRWLPRAQGRATPIQKKGSHITIILAESEKIKPSRFKIAEVEKPKKSQKADEHEHEHEHEHVHDHEYEHIEKKEK